MTYGATFTPTSGRRRPVPPAPHVLIQRSPEGDEPDLVDRLLDLQERIRIDVARRAAGESPPLAEQLELEREKVAVLRQVRDRGNDVDVVLAALAAATHRVSVLVAQLAREIEDA